MSYLCPDLLDHLNTLYPSYKFFNVEITDSLRNTRSGETLLLMDIMLAGAANTKYYSVNKDACKRYISSQDSLKNAINVHNDSIKDLKYKSINETYLKLKYTDSPKQSVKLDTSEIKLLRKIKEYAYYYLFKSYIGSKLHDDTIDNYPTEIDSVFNIDYSSSVDLKASWTDYTYNDENADYTFYFNIYDKRLKIDGEPNYTFLRRKYSDYYRSDYEIDSLFTNYYLKHSDLIKNLNNTVVTNAQHFGKVAAFFRYLKSEYPKQWIQVYAHYSRIKKAKGETPRFIDRYPNEN